ncbi:MAG: DUF4394 domain-containing protein [Moraxellaceae bacterium]|nr:DUF4394 domain-containing protein [Moraxellaceae bacterium]
MKTLSFAMLCALALGGCATGGPANAPAPAEKLVILTASGDLLRVTAARPDKVLARTAVKGLAADERLVGIDYRVARGELFGLSSRGQLYKLDAATGAVTAVGEPVALPEGSRFGFDFNPAADRIRVVSDTGANLRRHPDTGAQVSRDPDLAFVPAAAIAARPIVTAAGYTYNKRDEKLTTNYALDLATGSLVIQGSKEGEQPVVSPNTGLLAVVGPLLAGSIEDAALDIADVNNTALAALRSAGRTQLYQIDLDTGRASRIGRIGSGEAIAGMAIEP